MINIKNFLGAKPIKPILGRGLGTLSLTPAHNPNTAKPLASILVPLSQLEGD